jgi:hypothetical protein
MARPRKNSFRIRGIVRDATSAQGIAGLRVEAWDNDLLFDDLVGSVITASDGSFEIEFDQSYFQELFLDRRPDLYFKVFRGNRLLKSTRDATLWNVGAGDTPVLIEVDVDVTDGETRPAEPFRLTGRVRTERGTPAEGITLRFYRPGFGGSGTQLGEVVTGSGGAYVVELELEGDGPLLDVRAVVGAEETSLVTPGHRAVAGEPLDLIIAADRLPAPAPEFVRLTTDLRPHLNGASLADAREDNERGDITVLHERTGWDARLIALAAAAEQLAEHTKVDAQVAYGLVRAGLPTDPVQLARVSREGIAHALDMAVDAGVVSLSADQVAGAQETLEAFGRRERRKLGMFGTASSYGSMLKATGLSEAEQERFDTLFSAHTGSAEELWQKARDEGLPDDQLKLTAQLSTFTLNSARLVQSLREEIGATEKLADTLVSAGFYEPSAWKARLRELADDEDRVLGHMIPSAYQGEAVSERLDAYAADLAANVRRS